MNADLKTELLERSNNGLDFFKIYFGDQLRWATKKRSKNLKNPFYRDKNGSLSIYEDDSGRWRFKDYGDSNFQGDCFNLYALEYSIDINTGFNDLLLKMKQVLEERKTKIDEELPNEINFEKSEIVKVDLHEVVMSDEANKFWQDYGITEKILKTNQVTQINGYTLTYKDGLSKYIWQGDMTFAYKMGSYYKIYRPTAERKYKFSYLGKHGQEHVFGWNYQTDSKLLFITGGEKDVMTLHSLGFQAICVGSEVATISRRLVKELYYDEYIVVVLYDLDETGRREATKLSREHLWQIANLSSIVEVKSDNNLKDVSDYIKNELSIDKLKVFLNQFDDKKLECNAVIENIQTEEVGEIDEIEDFVEQNEKQSYASIPKKVYENLPPLIQRITTPFKNQVQKDLLLAASLGVLSNLVEVSGVYRRNIVYPNLFIFITAPAGSGKGVMKWTRKLGNCLQNKYDQNYKNAKAEYEEDNKKGEKPKRQTVFQAANASVPAFIKQLFKNNSRSIVFETEADSLNGVMKNDDWGSFSDMLRRFFEFEDVSMLRVDEENSIEIENPRVSIVLSGTKDQLFKLMPSSQNGLYSRFLFMDFPRLREWGSSWESDESLDNYFNSLSTKVYNYFQKTKECNIKFRFTSTQQY
ncbi:DUF3987 domain-containing protein [Flavobacterium sp. ST-75]|uniref:DUF3987 domain-containing protein n=1 Tax=Flavobacterium rhizophilum TaxID=3163296 RepID=A0ABW8YB49_9FLAO